MKKKPPRSPVVPSGARPAHMWALEMQNKLEVIKWFHFVVIAISVRISGEHNSKMAEDVSVAAEKQTANATEHTFRWMERNCSHDQIKKVFVLLAMLEMDDCCFLSWS